MSKLSRISPIIQARLNSALDTIRPYLKADGGDMEVVRLTENMILQIKFLGTCSSCKISEMTLRSGVEQTVLKAVPEIKAVEVVSSD